MVAWPGTGHWPYRAARTQRRPGVRRAGPAGPDRAGAAGREHEPGQFRITASGQRELAGWLRTTPDPASGDELVLKACQVPGTDVHEVIQVHRRYLIESMQRRSQIKRDGGVQELGLALAGATELSRLDSLIRWLDTADGLVGWVSDAR